MAPGGVGLRTMSGRLRAASGRCPDGSGRLLVGPDITVTLCAHVLAWPTDNPDANRYVSCIYAICTVNMLLVRCFYYRDYMMYIQWIMSLIYTNHQTANFSQTNQNQHWAVKRCMPAWAQNINPQVLNRRLFPIDSNGSSKCEILIICSRYRCALY